MTWFSKLYRNTFPWTVTSYILAFAIIAICLMTMFLMGQWTLDKQTESLDLIANNQRGKILAQKISSTSHRLAYASNRDDFLKARNRLLQLKHLFEKNLERHNQEIQNRITTAVSQPSKLPDRDLNQSALAFMTQVNKLTRLAFGDQELKSTSHQIVDHAVHDLTNQLDVWATAVKWNARQEIELARRLEAALFVAALGVLVFEALCVFQPILTAHEKIDWAANHDPLTSLPNRRHLASCAKTALINSRQSGASIGFMHLDLDSFKAVNDKMGHGAGDAILRGVAIRLRRHLAKKYLIARVGGDEFAVLCPSIRDVDELVTAAKKLIKVLAEPILFEDMSCTVGCSIGIAIAGPNEKDFERVLMDADIALYAAKNNGRNQYKIITDRMRSEFVLKERVSKEIREGIEAKQFVPFFQPQIDSNTGQVIGVESLARWIKPRGIFSPNAEFIALAEEIGLLVEIDEQILNQSLEALVRWRDLGHRIPRISLNFSLQDLERGDILDHLQSSLVRFGLTSKDVGIEVLEPALFQGDTSSIIKHINDLSRAGFAIELDNFGTGHAAVTSLIDLSVDRIKLDKTLIHDLEFAGPGQTITRTLVRLAEELNISTVAEGVETITQVEFLRSIGCVEHQGFYYAEPMSCESLCDWLAEHARSKTEVENVV